MEDLELRRLIYDRLVADAVPPTRAELGNVLGSARAADDGVRRLHDAHMVVLGDDGEIAMALPFATRPTGHRVVAGDMAWWANCAWDALAIPAALDGLGRSEVARIEATWMDTGEPVQLEVGNGELSSLDGFVHFSVPAAKWWDDIVET